MGARRNGVAGTNGVIVGRRPDRWWMRWYVVCGVRGSTAGGVAIDDDEWVECVTLTERGARRVCRWAMKHNGLNLHPVRRSVWVSEHAA